MKGSISLFLATAQIPPLNAITFQLVDGKQVRISADGTAEVDYDNSLDVDSAGGVDQSAKAQTITAASEADQEQSSTQLQRQYDFYHTGDQIKKKLTKLQNTCKKADMQMWTESKSVDGYTVDIDVVKLTKKDAPPSQHNMFMLFGEHARELISPESSLNFINSVCDGYASKALDSTSFTIVPNGNPNSRKQVESGRYCVRVNQRGVDLNRNWDEHWDANTEKDSDVYSGPQAFSEPETRIFKDLVAATNATSFVTVHSGTLGMYQSPAYDYNLPTTMDPRARQSMRILEKLDEKYCQCPFGAAGHEVGYSCPGTCLDYAWDKLKVPYTFAFEIYTDPGYNDELAARFDKIKKRHAEEFKKMDANSYIQKQQGFPQMTNDTRSHFVSLFQQKAEMKMTAKQILKREMEMDCEFSQFNPTSKSEYVKTLQTWTKLYTNLAINVAKSEDGYEQNKKFPKPSIFQEIASSFGEDFEASLEIQGDSF